MARPQVDYQLPTDGDRYGRADLAVQCEVLGKRVAHALETGITHAVNCHASCHVHHDSSLRATVVATSAHTTNIVYLSEHGRMMADKDVASGKRFALSSFLMRVELSSAESMMKDSSP
jgi:hypothetical protein